MCFNIDLLNRNLMTEQRAFWNSTTQSWSTWHRCWWSTKLWTKTRSSRWWKARSSRELYEADSNTCSSNLHHHHRSENWTTMLHSCIRSWGGGLEPSVSKFHWYSNRELLRFICFRHEPSSQNQICLRLGQMLAAMIPCGTDILYQGF